MNITRGLFRLWLIFSLLYVAGVAAISFSDVKKEFDLAALDLSQFGIALLPVDCSAARGVEKIDYATDAPSSRPKCWYDLPTFRKLYPEYKAQSDAQLSDSLYAKAGIISNPPRPWLKLGMFAAIALLPPLFILILGWLLIWALRGFKGSASSPN